MCCLFLLFLQRKRTWPKSIFSKPLNTFIFRSFIFQVCIRWPYWDHDSSLSMIFILVEDACDRGSNVTDKIKFGFRRPNIKCMSACVLRGCTVKGLFLCIYIDSKLLSFEFEPYQYIIHIKVLVTVTIWFVKFSASRCFYEKKIKIDHIKDKSQLSYLLTSNNITSCLIYLFIFLIIGKLTCIYTYADLFFFFFSRLFFNTSTLT